MESFKEMRRPDHLTCLLRNPYVGQAAKVRIGRETNDWLNIRKGVHQGCVLSLCLFNLYAECIMQKTGLDESKTGVKIVRRKSKNFRHSNDTTLMVDSEEELHSLLI